MQGENADQIIIDDPCVPGVPISENPQNKLQFVKRNGQLVLQQLWVTSSLSAGGILVPISIDWRDVPVVEEPANASG